MSMTKATRPEEKQFIYYVENEENGFALEKKRLKALPAAMRSSGVVLSFPMTRKPRGKDELTRTQTIEFPLEGPEVRSVTDLIESYNTFSAINSESIFGYYAKLYTLGWDVYGSSAPAIAAQVAKSKQGFINQVEQAIASEEKPFSFDAISSWLAKGKSKPRSTAKSDNKKWDTETMTRLVTNCFSKDVETFTDKLVELTLASAENWDAVNTDVLAASTAVALNEVYSANVTGEALMNACIQGDPDFTGLDKDSISLAKKLTKRTLCWSGEFNQPELSDTYYLHQAISRAAHFCYAEVDEGKSLKTSMIVERLLPGLNFSGAAWILGNGLHLFNQSNKELISKTLEAPINEVEKIVELAKPIAGCTKAFGSASDYRVHLGGAIASFVELYWKRLEEIQSYLYRLADLVGSHSIPDIFFDETNEYSLSLFKSLAVDQNELQELWASLPGQLDSLIEIHAQLMGKGSRPPVENDIHTYKEGLERIYALGTILNQLFNNFNQFEHVNKQIRSEPEALKIEEYIASVEIAPELLNALARKGAQRDQGDSEKKSAQVGKKNLFNPPSLNMIGSFRESSEKVYQDAKARFPEIMHWFTQYSNTIGSKEAYISDLIEVYAQKEFTQRSARMLEVSEEQALFYARRKLFDEWFTFWRTLSEESRLFAAKTLIELKRSLAFKKHADKWSEQARNFIFERKGAYYVGLLSRRRHEPLPILTSGLLELDFNQLITQMVDWVRAHQHDSPALQLDAVNIAIKLADLKAKSLVESIRSESINPLSSAPEWFSIPLATNEKEALTNGSLIHPRMLERIISKVGVAVRGYAIILSKETSNESFAIKPTSALKVMALQIQTLNDDGTPRLWRPPAWIAKGTCSIAKTWRSLELTSDEAIEVNDVYDAIKDQLGDSNIRALLSVLPHRWGWGTSLSGITQQGYEANQPVLSVEKKTIKPANFTCFFTLNVPPNKHLILDEILKGKSDNGAGSLKIEITRSSFDPEAPYSQQLTMQVPLSRKVEEVEPDVGYYDRVIGIDLGERGIGFSVRKLGESNPELSLIDRGFVRIPSIRKLINSTEAFRRKHVREMKNNRNDFVDYGKLRDSVAGDVFSRIKTLMYHYKAFPVLEDAVDVDKGNKHLNQVYAQVQSFFCFSDVKTLDARREHKWRGTYSTHPFYKRKIMTVKKSKEVIKYADLNLHPGVKASSYGSSQECPSCRRNATKALKALEGRKLEVKPGGIVSLEDGDIRLFDSKVVQGERFRYPLEPKIRLKTDIVKQVSLQRRLRPLHKSLDTTQSIYVCPYADCGMHEHEVHADVNAADVIALRCIDNVVHVDHIS